MIGVKSLTIINPNFPSISKPLSPLPLPNSTFPFKTQFKNPKTQSKFPLFATNNNSDEPQKQQNNDLKEDKNPIFNVKLGDLLLNPDPDNLVAVGLTGLLAWASAQVLWQLLIVSLAILVAAVKNCGVYVFESLYHVTNLGCF
ncbi:hypothetical protein M5689_001541 [Euphorbia peplus]|nr:hypothetical protein M5689_001541 [Euphorbia peplus]